MITGSTFDSFGHRTLAAIVFTDVVSYSARMNVDEEHTLGLVQRDLQLMSEICQKHGGQVLKFTGDGLLMHFHSAVQAVACAQETQQSIVEQAKDLVETEILWHRIGIHLGDVFLSKTDVMGDGVNIAARLQSEAQPGGICMSRTVYDVVKRCLTLKATYLGPRDLKNIKEAVHVYQILMAAIEKEDSIPSLFDEQGLNYNPANLILDETEILDVYPNSTSPTTPQNDLSTQEPPVDAVGSRAFAATVETTQFGEGASEQDFSASISLDGQTSGEAAYPTPSNLLPSDLHKQLEVALNSILGPIGSLVLNQALRDTSTLSEAVNRMMLSIPAEMQEDFYAAATEIVSQLPPHVSKHNSPSSEQVESISNISDATSQAMPSNLPREPEELGLTDRDIFAVSEFQMSELCKKLAEYLGPMAKLTLQSAVESAKTPQDLVTSLLEWLPGDCHVSFRDFSTNLLSQGKGIDTSARCPIQPTSSTPSIRKEPQSIEIEPSVADPLFLEFCETELAKHLGPIAAIALQQVLSNQTPAKNRQAIVQQLATYITNPDDVADFQQALQQWTQE